ncbi:hypothetical protein D3C71_1092440 [compost metagenome]
MGGTGLRHCHARCHRHRFLPPALDVIDLALQVLLHLVQLPTIDRITAARGDHAIGHVAEDHALRAAQIEAAGAVSAGGGFFLEQAVEAVVEGADGLIGLVDGTIQRGQCIAHVAVLTALHLEGRCLRIARCIHFDAAAERGGDALELTHRGGIVVCGAIGYVD